MLKVDFRRQVETYSARRGSFAVVTVPPMQFLMVDGRGDPNTSPEYAAALASLYPLAYGLKFLSKGELDRDYVVMPLEALWWSRDMDAFTTARDKSRWEWTLMTMVPDWITHRARRAGARRRRSRRAERPRSTRCAANGSTRV